MSAISESLDAFTRWVRGIEGRLEALETFVRQHREERDLTNHHDFVRRLEALERGAEP